MATEALLKLMQQQMEEQRRQMEEQRQQHADQMKLLTAALTGTSVTANTAWPTFPAFDSIGERWKDYWSRFQTLLGSCINLTPRVGLKMTKSTSVFNGFWRDLLTSCLGGLRTGLRLMLIGFLHRNLTPRVRLEVKPGGGQVYNGVY